MRARWSAIAATAGGLVLAASSVALADPCPGHPEALGTSRVLLLDPIATPVVGTINHGQMLPLAPGEVVLTFDDGPRSPTTQLVLETLARHCVKAVFFMIGRNAKAEPQVARIVLAAGHTIGTHTENHPRGTMAPERALREINTGILHVSAALGDPQAVAPFFRFPGLRHTAYAEQYLRTRSIAAWSVDIDSHDWKPIAPQQVVDNVLTRLAAKGRGIILLHDVQAKTAEILPVLLAELKQRGYRVVHVVPVQRPPSAPPELIAAPQPAPAKAAAIRTVAAASIAHPSSPRHLAVAKARLSHTTEGGLRQRSTPTRVTGRVVAAPQRRALYR